MTLCCPNAKIDKDISNDIDFMKRLSSLTNVVPVLAKSDTLSPQEAIALKTSILARLQTAHLKPFLFGKGLDDALLAVQSLSIIHTQLRTMEPEQYPFTTPTYPYAISSTPGPDNETMDASLLMSPDYVQPLLPSELVALVNQVFEPDSIAWLRHSAAKKFLAWQRRTKLTGDSFILQGLQQPRSPTTTASVGLNGAAMHSKIRRFRIDSKLTTVQPPQARQSSRQHRHQAFSFHDADRPSMPPTSNLPSKAHRLQLHTPISRTLRTSL